MKPIAAQQCDGPTRNACCGQLMNSCGRKHRVAWQQAWFLDAAKKGVKLKSVLQCLTAALKKKAYEILVLDSTMKRWLLDRSLCLTRPLGQQTRRQLLDSSVCFKAAVQQPCRWLLDGSLVKAAGQQPLRWLLDRSLCLKLLGSNLKGFFGKSHLWKAAGQQPRRWLLDRSLCAKLLDSNLIDGVLTEACCTATLSMASWQSLCLKLLDSNLIDGFLTEAFVWSCWASWQFICVKLLGSNLVKGFLAKVKSL